MKDRFRFRMIAAAVMAAAGAFLTPGAAPLSPEISKRVEGRMTSSRAKRIREYNLRGYNIARLRAKGPSARRKKHKSARPIRRWKKATVRARRARR